jgi:hypothetical membrane protein
MNPLILIALILQSVVAKSNRMTGAILGYIITTGIMLWGFGVYAEGDRITLFSIPLSESAFLIACLVWYGFDTREYVVARNQNAKAGVEQPTPQGE